MDPLNVDFMDMLEAMNAEHVEYVVIGGYAMALHGVPRATGDLDLFVRATPENAARTFRALQRFGAPVQALGFEEADLSQPGMVFQMGNPPRRIDLTTRIQGVTFDEVWSTREHQDVGPLRVPYIGREALLRNKRAAARPKDLADVDTLTRPKPC
jgi:hypothetical protein